MAKKYYWLKLKEDFFEEDAIEWLEEQENGKSYCLFYLKLCLKAIKDDGILIRRVGDILVPYDEKKLAEMTKTEFDTVVIAMRLFKEIGLVQILENGEIYLTQLDNMVGSETKWAAKKRLQREGGGQNGDNVPRMSQKCPREKENRERDKELEKEREKENTHAPEEGESSFSESESSDQEPEVFLELGKYNHVLLTVKQIDSLKAELGEETYLACITKLDSYCEKTGKTYNNYEIAIRDWVLGQVQEDQKQAKAKKCEAEKKKKTDYSLIYSKRENNSG